MTGWPKEMLQFIHKTAGNNVKKIERKTMPVKGGVAWTVTIKWRKRKPWRTKFLQRDFDGVIRKKMVLSFLKGEQTGDCPECKCMPCHHTAKLLGWET